MPELPRSGTPEGVDYPSTADPPFQQRSLKPPTLIQRLLRIRPTENAVIEINNLLAKDIRGVTNEAIGRIATDYRVDFREQLINEVDAMYGHYLTHCLNDRHLSQDEIDDLAHLKARLRITDPRAKAIHRAVAEKVYANAIDGVLADKRLSQEEVAFLKRLQNEVVLPDPIAVAIWAKSAQDCVRTAREAAISDRRLSPEEDAELEAISKSLNVTIETDMSTESVLEKLRLFWRIENDELPKIDPGINLMRGEVCHYVADVEWFESRRVTRRIRYGGPTFRVKIVRGVYWSAGDIGVQRVSEDVMTRIDSGRTFITNKRLIFMGQTKNTNIRLNRILDFTAFQNGIEIEKDAGKTPFLGFTDGVDLFSMILGKAIERQL